MVGEARIVSVSDVNEGEILVAEVDGEPVVVCKIAGEFYAIGGVCPHAMGPLEATWWTNSPATAFPWRMPPATPLSPTRPLI